MSKCPNCQKYGKFETNEESRQRAGYKQSLDLTDKINGGEKTSKRWKQTIWN